MDMIKVDIVRKIAMQVGQEKQVVLQVIEGIMDSVKLSKIIVSVHNIPVFKPQNLCGKNKNQTSNVCYVIGALFRRFYYFIQGNEVTVVRLEQEAAVY